MQVRSADEVRDAAASPAPADALAVDPAHPLVLDALDADAADVPLGALRHVPAVLVAIGAHPDADVVVDDPDGAARVCDAVAANPVAATSLVLALRAAEGLAVPDALVVESATYSALQAGPEHAAWLAGERRRRPALDAPRPGEAVRTRRDGAALRVTLARPSTRNAVDATMQAALVDALAVALDPGVTSVVLDGEGPVFSAGGDLAEFGTRPDPATAHLVRLARSPALALHRVAAKATAHVHGACHGAGVELPSFCARVVADPGTTFRLPEVAMGLVPGAGGTVGLPRRIGRQRTAWLAVTGEAVDAATALAWGLVDEVAERR